jgi:hypothetical protein
VKHRAGIKELGIKAEIVAPAGKGAPVIDTGRVVEQQWRLGIPDQFGHFTRQLGVGDDNTRNRPGRRVACV